MPMFTCAYQSEKIKSKTLKGMRLILMLSSVFGMLACSDSIVTSEPIESGANRQDTSKDNSAQRLIKSFMAEDISTKIIQTPSGNREVYDPTQIPSDVSLVFDATLNRAYEYFARLKECDGELELDKKDICLSRIKNVYADLWGNNALPRNRFAENLRLTDPAVPTYPSSAFKWRLTLHGLLDEFIINSKSYFPSNIDGELVTLYLDHLESNDAVKRLPVWTEDRLSYKVPSKDSLRNNVPEFKLSDFMPKKYRPGPVLSGYEFTMLFGKENSEIHEGWNTVFLASHCQRAESFFYKIQIAYESAWLREFMGGRNIATIHVCAPDTAGEPRVTIFRLE